MKRMFMLVVLAITAWSFSASAASLRVDAGVLQAWSFDFNLCQDQPEICTRLDDPEETYELVVIVWRMAGSSGRVDHDHPDHGRATRYLMPAGEPYQIAWSDRDPRRPCQSGDDASTGFEPAQGEWFDAGTGEYEHIVCVQKESTGEPVVTIASGVVPSTVAPSATSSTKTSSTTVQTTVLDAEDEEQIEPTQLDPDQQMTELPGPESVDDEEPPMAPTTEPRGDGEPDATMAGGA
jgi:hypothetical protein